MSDFHDSAYAGLLVNDAHWAFGTSFEDPLAGVDTTIPDGVDPDALAAVSLMLGDDALVMAQRLSEWCSRAPDLEEDIALSNIALDLLGQARLLLARAAAADPAIVPGLPADSPVPSEDALAFFRGDQQFRNVRLVEVPNGDFAQTIARLLLFATARLAVLGQLTMDPVLAAVAAKGVKELAYHRDFAARWFVTLALGTMESRDRLVRGIEAVWPLVDELFETHHFEAALGLDPAATRPAVTSVWAEVFDAAELELPVPRPLAGVRGRKGRDGSHTEALSLLLAQMQVVAREHPRARW